MIGHVKLVEIDARKAKLLQAALHGLAQVHRAGIMNPLPRTDAQPAALGGNHQAGRIRRQRFGDQFFAHVGAIGVGGVDKVDLQLDGAAQRCQGGGAILGRSPDAIAGDAHGAESEPVHRQFAAEGYGAGGTCRDLL